MKINYSSNKGNLKKNNLKEKNFEKKIKKHFMGIYYACGKKFWYSCGSYLIDGQRYKYDKQMIGKQMLLFDLAKKNSRVLEIGVYMGHSILIMLASNPKLEITGIDIDERFAPKAINYLKKKFPKAKLDFLKGDSIITVNSIIKKYDLFHIDGDHKTPKIFREIIACTKLTKNNNMKILFDDVDMMKSLERSLILAFQVKKYIKPKSKYPNLYLEIKLDKISIFKFKLFFYFFYLFELPGIIFHFLKSLIRNLLLIFVGKKICNNLGKFILNYFTNNYLISFGKKLKNI